MLRFDKMTVKAQEALQQANEVAAKHENQQIEPVHLLEALVSQTDGVVPPLLARLGIHAAASVVIAGAIGDRGDRSVDRRRRPVRLAS